jgi:hypothetical protein
LAIAWRGGGASQARRISVQAGFSGCVAKCTRAVEGSRQMMGAGNDPGTRRQAFQQEKLK